MTEPYKPTESDLAEREEVKAQMLDLLKQLDELEARVAKLDAMPPPETSEARARLAKLGEFFRAKPDV